MQPCIRCAICQTLQHEYTLHAACCLNTASCSSALLSLFISLCLLCFFVLQAPLQPLQDNLESATYETFENDTTKYITYQAAIHAALLDCSPQSGNEEVVIMVVGAGRGPLVTASLQVCTFVLFLQFHVQCPEDQLAANRKSSVQANSCSQSTH